MPLRPLTGLLHGAEQAGLELGVHPDLCADDRPDWEPLTEDFLSRGLRATAAAYDAPPHVAAALWWKGYCYWAALPVVLGWALNRRVPLMSYEETVARPVDDGLHTVVALRTVTVAVTSADPYAGEPGTTVVSGDRELLAVARETLLGGHLAPLISSLNARTRVGDRTLWGSVAEAIAHPLVAYGDLLIPGGDASGEAAALLSGLGTPVADLADLISEPPGLRRRTCCLWVTLPDKPACDTCCISRRR